MIWFMLTVIGIALAYWVFRIARWAVKKKLDVDDLTVRCEELRAAVDQQARKFQDEKAHSHFLEGQLKLEKDRNADLARLCEMLESGHEQSGRNAAQAAQKLLTAKEELRLVGMRLDNMISAMRVLRTQWDRAAAILEIVQDDESRPLAGT